MEREERKKGFVNDLVEAGFEREHAELLFEASERTREGMTLQEQVDFIEVVTEECASCGYPMIEAGECPQSKRPCGHRCNHSWTHDECCWCGQEFGECESAEDE